ncbi:hypothetical protein [Pseudonocardia charpentierae]|uniref:FCD domain-containing protein n=1 Tax=Pseudonocardia charpentierae TaxID=3075545 RepID=A0ABU2N931_9PSEU|nr:hypothetical protein [Pseudonocardia sp. DSM 45834]MDT0350460.1 hypothetical protein [Pseudonocardia sp. DSM 45834]
MRSRSATTCRRSASWPRCAELAALHAAPPELDRIRVVLDRMDDLSLAADTLERHIRGFWSG